MSCIYNHVASDDISAARSIAGRCLVMRLRRLDRKITRIYDDALRPHGITSAQLNLLVAVAIAAPVPPSVIASALELEKSTLSRNVAKMVDRGWIESERAEGGGLLLHATDSGLELVAEVKPQWERAQRQARRVLDPQLVAELAALPADEL